MSLHDGVFYALLLCEGLRRRTGPAEYGQVGGTAREGDAKFFGVEIVPEKEMLMILAPADKAAQIADAIKGLECFSKGGSGIIYTTNAQDFSLLGKK